MRTDKHRITQIVCWLAFGLVGGLGWPAVAGALGPVRPQPSFPVTEFPLSVNSTPFEIAAGPDGNMWFTQQDGQIGRITPAGTVRDFSTGLGLSSPGGIAAGPDGNLWFTDDGGSQIGRITTAGVITEFSAGISAVGSGIAAGPGNTIWFTESGADRIGVLKFCFLCSPKLSQSATGGSAVLSARLQEATSVGILVERIIRGERVRVGRVPFGLHRKGRLALHWKLRVNGRRLSKGKYLITLRALGAHGRVIALANPLTLTIR